MSTERGTKRDRILFQLALLAISLLILIRIVDFKSVFRHVLDLPLFVFGVLVAIAMFRTWLMGLRWRLVNPDVSGQLSHWQYFRLMMISVTYNLIMPGALGGDFAKMALVMKSVKDKRLDNVIAIVADRFIGLLSITLLGTIGLVFMSEIPDKRAFYAMFLFLNLGFTLGLLAAGSSWFLRVVESVFSRMGRLGKRLILVLETWKDALQYFKCNYRRVLLALLICLPIHCLSFLTAYILAVNLGMKVSFFDISMILSLVWVITAIPLTISGAGVRELSLIYFLSQYGIGSEPATALSVYLYIVSVAIGLIGIGFILMKEE